MSGRGARLTCVTPHPIGAARKPSDNVIALALNTMSAPIPGVALNKDL